MSDNDMKKVLGLARDTARRHTTADQAQADFVEAHEARAAAARGLETLRLRYTDALTSAVGVATRATIEATAKKLGPPLAQCIAQFVKEHATKKSWDAKTAAKYQVVYDDLVAGLGNVAINTIGRDDMVDWLALLVRQPKNAGSMKALKDLSFRERADIEDLPTLSASTINDRLSRASGFFSWAMRVEAFHMVRNPAERMSIPNKGSIPRRGFGIAQLVAIFSHHSWQDREFLHPHQYWLPLIGMLTGMRLNEICQLTVRDFVKVGQIDCIKCADLSEGARAKNANATRTFPIHETLIELGLLRYVDWLKAHKHRQLFPELKEGRDGFGSSPSKWFGRYCTDVGVTEACYVFHSFRHYFIGVRLNQLEIAKHFVQAIVGHEQEDVTTDTYWEGDFEALQRVVNASGVPTELAGRLPRWDDVLFVKLRRFPPSRLGARKSRAKRVEDAAQRKAARAAKSVSEG